MASDGTQGNYGSSSSAISTDGRYVAFYSGAGNLISGDTNGIEDIFVHDQQTGETTRVSIASDGTQGNGFSQRPSISGDGRYVAFRAWASNLVSGDTNGAGDIFVHDRQTGETTRISVASNGTQGNNDSDYPSISADGQYVAFRSLASNLINDDSNGNHDIFVHDRQTREITLISVASDGTQGNFISTDSSISADGRYVAFRSLASNLVSNDTNGYADVFVHDRGDGNSPSVILVQNESGDPISGAQAYRNGNLAGTTSVTGTLTIPGLQVNDQLVARQQITEIPTAKNNHNQDSTQNWASRVYITSLDIPSAGEPAPFIVTNPTLTQTLTLRNNNTLIGFNIVASVGWDANNSYLEELQQGFEQASTYLYDASDGQMLFERVSIYDDFQFWTDADYQIQASNQRHPSTRGINVITINGNHHMFFGRYWDSHSANQGAWTQPDGYRTFIHEFGHYGLNLFDSYFYRGNNGAVIENFCTSATIRTNSDDPINATLMAYQYNATEFSMRGVNGLWTPQCEQTVQWQENEESDWETIVNVYQDDTNNPEQWLLRTPAGRGTVVAGPSTIPQAVTAWSTVNIENNANTGICASPPTIPVRGTFNRPLGGASVHLLKNESVIYQGLTGRDGRITVLGAADGDTVCYRDALWGFDQSGTIQISCTSGQMIHAIQSIEAELDLSPFTLNTFVMPEGSNNQIRVIVQASTPLGATPQVRLYQPGAATIVDVSMTYDAGTDTYSGITTLDSALSPSGIIQVSATDTNAQSLSVFSSFEITEVSPAQAATVRSNDGQVELYLPVNSLSASGRISVFPDTTTTSPNDDLVRLSGPYRIQPESGIGLVSNAGLTFRYLDTGGSLQEAKLDTAQVYRWNGVSQWIPVNTNLLPSQNVASASISSFGTYVLLAEPSRNVYLPVVTKNN